MLIFRLAQIAIASFPIAVFGQTATYQPNPGKSGIDLDAMDTAVSPCTNFYEYSCGLWRAKNPMPPKKDAKGKDKGGKAGAKSAAGPAKKSGGAKQKKKKWTKGKVKEKLNNAVYLDKATHDRMIKEIPKSKMISSSIVSDRLKVNVSVARRGLRELAEKKLILPIAIHSKQSIYTRATAAAATA